MDPAGPYLLVPGWGDSGPEHWQTLWQPELGAARVNVGDWFDARKDVWIAALTDAIAVLARRDPRPPVLVAHSLGCIAIAHWAQAIRRPVRAAFLVAPADVESAPGLTMLRTFAPLPRERLPFTSLVVTSDDDEYVTVSRADAFATSWGSELHVVPGVGHLNTASGLGRWPLGRALLDALVERSGETRRDREL
jgi:predicted alpha/beta hydrolase family esterase